MTTHDKEVDMAYRRKMSTKNRVKAKLDGKPWSMVNRRRVTINGAEIGEIHRREFGHGWGGRMISYRFLSNERGQVVWGLPESMSHKTSKLLLEDINQEIAYNRKGE